MSCGAPAAGSGRGHRPVALTASLYEAGSVTILSLAGALESGSLAAMDAQVDQILCTDCQQLVVEASRLTSVDAAGVGALVELAATMAGRGGQLRIRGASGQVAQLLGGTPLIT